jgi:hypothetical protein
VFCAAIVIFSLTSLTDARAADPSNVQTFRVGLKSIVIPQPTAELAETGSDYRVMFELLAPNTNRLVAAFLRPDDLKSRIAGSADLSQYALVEVPRRAEFATVTPELFKQVSAGMAQQFGAAVELSLKDEQDEINRKLKSLNGTASTISLEKPLMLGTFFSKPDACSFGMILQMASNGNQKKLATAVTVMRVQERVLFLYTYAEYLNEDSVNRLRTTAEQWADAVLKANQ